MDDKWNVFVLEDFLYWARSWTNHRVFKIQLTRKPDFVMLKNAFVTRDKDIYTSENIDYNKNLVLKLLQLYVGRSL
jgi:hypothetical protein